MFKDTQHPYRCPGIGLEMVGVLVFLPNIILRGIMGVLVLVGNSGCPGIVLVLGIVGVLVLGIRTYRAGAALLPARFGGG
jgi:hypothetical protein